MIRAISEYAVINGRLYGLPLPRVKQWGDVTPMILDPDEYIQEDMLPCLFFADDGVLLAYDMAALQALMDVLVRELSLVGLSLNIKKTKCMVVAPLTLVSRGNGNDRPLAYMALVARALLSPLLVQGQAIEIVFQFDYLGVKLNWRWNWCLAWRDAINDAKLEYRCMLQGGFQEAGLSLSAQLEYIRSKISCH